MARTLDADRARSLTKEDVWVRPYEPRDLRDIVPNLRAADVDEIKAVVGVSPAAALPGCIAASRETLVFGAFDTPVAILGLQDVIDNPDVGIVWMLTTRHVEEYPFQFLRVVKDYLPLAHKYHPIITNHVDERNTVHIKWLRWMGFSFLRRIERWGAENRPFLEFARLNPCASAQLPS